MEGPDGLPPAVAGWLSYCRAHQLSLFDALTRGHAMPKVGELDEEAAADVALYFFEPSHDEDFARVWLTTAASAARDL
ncbi:hypothetical protein ACFQ3L_11390 [Lacticaseibacillus jixianensis]|uniref:Uncharacterized protein n=1 Tax=Lacticaseibacillus jixianensis TaxID=2486012 RepID=A0ABW4BAW9_9LACO